MKFQIHRRWYSTLPPVEVEIGAEFDGVSAGVRLGAALKIAFRNDADLSHADLSGAVLRGADLSHADLSHADLSHAVLSDAVLRGADVPLVPNIDAAILAAIEAGGALEMGGWHTCKTTHCRAGWAIHLAGKEGYALEEKVGAAAAGALIYAKSTPENRIPDFYCGNAEALEDLKERAAKATA